MNSTDKIKARYNRVAKVFDYMESHMQNMIPSDFTDKAFSKLYGKVLEVGVGTGRNLPYYPQGCEVTAIDFSSKMLEIAKKNIGKAPFPVKLLEMDAQNMTFPDNSFDCVINTCVFCSVPDPIKGLQEIKRVCKPGGTIIMIEHVRSKNPVIGLMMDILNPVVVNVIGANINRNTVDNIQKAGIKVKELEEKFGKILNLIIAEP